MASRRALTLPGPTRGMANSFPFSLTVVTSICRRRRSAIARSFESATRTPPVTTPWRVFPFQTNCAIRLPPYRLTPGAPRRARRRRAGRRRDRARAALQHLDELVRERRDRNRELLRDDAPVDERRERLVERLHPVLVLPRLHHRVDLVELVLADEVPDRGRRDEDLHRHAAALAGRAGRRLWQRIPSRTNDSCARTCDCWLAGKTSMTRFIVWTALFVWSVASVRWPSRRS